METAQLSKLYMNGGSNRHNYETYKMKNMLSIHMVQNGHKLKKKLKTACLEVFMMIGFITTILGRSACHAEVVAFKLKAE
jgi:hypothetical protein